MNKKIRIIITIATIVQLMVANSLVTQAFAEGVTVASDSGVLSQAAQLTGLEVASNSALTLSDGKTLPGLKDIQPGLSSLDTVSPTTAPLDLSTPSNRSGSILPPVSVRLLKNAFQVKDDVSVVVNNVSSENYYASIFNSKGEEMPVPVQKSLNNNQLVLTIGRPPEFRPGKYTVKIYDDKGQVSQQDFTWGVLAINTNKSIYTPGEQAKLAMAVLDQDGEMVCNAQLTLSITDPIGKTTTLSTQNGSIIVNPECRMHKVTEKPDYQATYTANSIGTYTMNLSATTGNGDYAITDNFQVQDSVPFDVERITATRIYPPEYYPVTFKITANQDFSGTIQDFVPESFNIAPSKTYSISKTTVTAQSNIPQGPDVLGASTPSLIYPLKGEHKITNAFGEEVDDPELAAKYKKFGLIGHDGIDFDVKMGTPVLAADSGIVGLADPNGDYGETIVIVHDWGKTYYGHLSKIEVKVGDKVQQGDEIGLSGDSGLSTGPHLHFGIKFNNNNDHNGYYGKVDPLPFLQAASGESVLGVSTTTMTKQTVKSIAWKVVLKKGDSITLSYSYKAPFISPEFYTIGKLRFTDNNHDTVFEEARYWQVAVDAVGTDRPNGDIAGGTNFANCVTNGNGSCRFGVVDESSEIAGDYLGTGTSGSGGEVEEFSMTSVAGTADPVSQVVVKFQANSAGGCQSNCDTVDTNIKIDGAYQTAQTTTMSATDTLYTVTFTGSWTGDDDLQVQFTRTVQGGGNPNNRDDDVRIYQVYADVTYTLPVAPVDATQYDSTHQTVISTGGSTTDGVSTNLYLNFDASSSDSTETFTPKVEVKDTSSSFTNTSTATGPTLAYDSSVPDDIRSTCAIHDTGNDQIVIWGGYTGQSTKNNTNNTWTFSLKKNMRSQYKLLSPAGTPPPANRAHVCVYDSLNKRMVVFAGWNGTTYLTSVYFLSLPTDGSTPTWSQPTISGTPYNSGQVLQACAIYDSANARMVMFGGYAGSTEFSNVYALSLPSAGTPTWTNLNPTGSITGRDGTVCDYNSDTQEMVVFGGSDGTNVLSQVWKLSLSGSPAWTQLSPTGTPPPGVSGAMGALQLNYSGSDDRLIIYGGSTANASTVGTNRSFQLTLPASGTPAWTEVTPPSGQAGLGRAFGASSQAIYDSNANRMLFFGGYDGTNFDQGDMMAIDMGTVNSAPHYSIIADVRHIHEKDSPAAFYDTVNHQMVSFGGSERGAGPSYSYHSPETWMLGTKSDSNYYFWDAGADEAPLYREGEAMVYDSSNARGVMCMGLSNVSTLNDCWSLSLPSSGRSSWTYLSPTGTAPTARWEPGYIYDSANKQMVVFGGSSTNSISTLNDTWFLSLPASNGTPAWTQPTTSGTAPAARWQPSAIYDPGRQRMIVFGGASANDGTSTTYYNDVWELSLPTNGSTPTWRQMSPTGTGPAGRRGAVAVYDPDNGSGVARMIVFGGFDNSTYYNDVWQLTLPASGDGAWTQLSPTGTAPGGRRSAVAVYDSVNDQMLLYAGRNSSSFLNDTWALSLGVSPAWTQINPYYTIPVSVPVTGLTLGTSYHWQGWVTGSNTGDSPKIAYGGNSDTPQAGIDFTISSGGGGSETPTLDKLMRHGQWFNSSGAVQPFTY